MTLAEAFLKEAQRRKDYEWTELLGTVARLAMWPWDLGTVTIYLDDNQRSVRTIWIEFEHLRGYPFRFQFDELQMMQAYDPKAYLIQSMHRPLFEHLRYRPSLPVDDHIILGEE